MKILKPLIEGMFRIPNAIFLIISLCVIIFIPLTVQAWDILKLSSWVERLTFFVMFSSFGFFNIRTYVWFRSLLRLDVWTFLVLLPFLFGGILSLNLSTSRQLLIAQIKICKLEASQSEECQKMYKTVFNQ